MRDEHTLMSGRTVDPAPDCFLGAVENPFAPPAEFQADRLGQKVAGGAQFVQTQFVFDVAVFSGGWPRSATSGCTSGAPSWPALAFARIEAGGTMDVDLRAVKKLRESAAARAALGPILEAVCGGSGDLSRLRVICDWIEYRQSFREAVVARPIAGTDVEIAYSEPGDLVRALARRLNAEARELAAAAPNSCRSTSRSWPDTRSAEVALAKLHAMVAGAPRSGPSCQEAARGPRADAGAGARVVTACRA